MHAQSSFWRYSDSGDFRAGSAGQFSRSTSCNPRYSFFLHIMQPRSVSAFAGSLRLAKTCTTSGESRYSKYDQRSISTRN
jgi:hypothetical protein